MHSERHSRKKRSIASVVFVLVLGFFFSLEDMGDRTFDGGLELVSKRQRVYV
jgi:hypothetical protein